WRATTWGGACPRTPTPSACASRCPTRTGSGYRRSPGPPRPGTPPPCCRRRLAPKKAVGLQRHADDLLGVAHAEKGGIGGHVERVTIVGVGGVAGHARPHDDRHLTDLGHEHR